MRAYQLLQDLTLGTTVQSFYSEEEIQQRSPSPHSLLSLPNDLPRFMTTINSLKQWKANEYVTAAAFEYLAALYFKNVKHEYSGSCIVLLSLRHVDSPSCLARQSRTKSSWSWLAKHFRI
jgi:hypothetical protein